MKGWTKPKAFRRRATRTASFFSCAHAGMGETCKNTLHFTAEVVARRWAEQRRWDDSFSREDAAFTCHTGALEKTTDMILLHKGAKCALGFCPSFSVLFNTDLTCKMFLEKKGGSKECSGLPFDDCVLLLL